MSYHCYFDCLVLHILDSILCVCQYGRLSYRQLSFLLLFKRRRRHCCAECWLSTQHSSDVC